ncbi:BRO-N domain-containing protein [Acinetobacter radioresistens]|uniref:BRO-N domain-containing protein n=1 Tax=Acinetobacter radioresistens TaxID=40216 RepID=UPI000C340F8F|nr:BRO family protein [Acinetobacter radioresistens]PKH30927.1 hypothetical protein BJF94_08525 [Acinetobacter radioresistens]
MNSLSFNATQFHPIQQNDNQIWITSAELANTLSYKQADAVTKIFNRNSDEFTRDMTQMINNPQTPNLGVRVFSLRGCHLTTFFARTPVAKEFRKWVLDVLDNEVLQQQIDTRVKINAQQQATLKEIVDRRCEGSVKRRTELWSRHNQHFRIPRYSELLAIHFQDAVHYLETLTLRTKPETAEVHMNVRAMAIHLVWLAGRWRQFGPAIRTLNPQLAGTIHDHFIDGAFVGWLYIEKDKVAQLRQRIDNYPWHMNSTDRYNLLNRT